MIQSLAKLTDVNNILGVMIDTELKWPSHIDIVYSKLLKFTGIFHQLRCYEK